MRGIANLYCSSRVKGGVGRRVQKPTWCTRALQNSVGKNKISLLDQKKRENFDGTRDQFVVQSWLDQVKQYIAFFSSRD